MLTKISEDISKVHHLYQWHRPYRCCCCRWQIFRGEWSGNKFRNLVQQIANPQICELTNFVIFADLRHAWQFANLRFCRHYFLQFAYPHFFANLKLLQIRKFFIFLLTNTYLKCSNSKFYQIKNSAKQTCCQLSYNFAIKRGNFFKKMFNSLCLIAENLQTGSPTKFADLKFADSHISEICRFEIADWTQKFADLKKQMRGHLCKFATGVTIPVANFWTNRKRH